MSRHSRLLGSTALILAGSLTGTAVYSQDLMIDEIMVTAQKREQNQQDVGISITAFSGNQLEALGIENTTDITMQIPGMQVNAWSPNLTIFNLRGVSQNNFTDNLEAPVAVYLDDAYMGSLNGVSGQLFDVERVEVLRGPQGTLFGRNATGGLVHYVSRGATDEDANGYFKVSYGRFNDLALETAIGGSVSETVRYRVAGRMENADGYIKAAAALPGVFEAGDQNLGGKDGFAIRGTVQVDFSDTVTGDFWIKHSEDNDVDTGGYVFDNCSPEANGYCSVNAAGIGNGSGGVVNGITFEPASPFENFNETPGSLNRETTAYQASFDVDLGDGLAIKSITNYTDLTKGYREDADALPVLVINFDTNVDYRQFSQELRLSGENENLTWQTGLYYLDIEIDGDSTTIGAPVLGAAFDINGDVDDPSIFQDYLINSKNFSVFGHVEFSVSEKIDLIAGLRWSKDDKSIDYASELRNGSFGNTPLGTEEDYAAQVPGVDEINYSDWAGKIGLNYMINDDVMLFASWNRGIKGGNWTLASDLTADNFQHQEEVLYSYEAGFKSTIADGRARLNGTFFYYDYKDYQAFALTGGTPQVTNSDASSYGGELELFWSPDENWDIVLGVAVMDSKVDEVNGPAFQIGPDFTGGAGPATVGDCVLDAPNGIYVCDYAADTVEDAEFPNAPSFSGNYLVRYNLPFAKGNLAIQTDGAFFGEQFLEVTNGPSSIQESYSVHNASLRWLSDDEYWEVAAYVKNVFDQEYRAYALNLGILGTTSYFAPPRTYGFSVKYSW